MKCLISLQARVLDMYYMEGPKIFYRLGLAALKLFVAQGKHLGESWSPALYSPSLLFPPPPPPHSLSYRPEHTAVHNSHDGRPADTVVQDSIQPPPSAVGLHPAPVEQLLRQNPGQPPSRSGRTHHHSIPSYPLLGICFHVCTIV